MTLLEVDKLVGVNQLELSEASAVNKLAEDLTPLPDGLTMDDLDTLARINIERKIEMGGPNPVTHRELATNALKTALLTLSAEQRHPTNL